MTRACFCQKGLLTGALNDELYIPGMYVNSVYISLAHSLQSYYSILIAVFSSMNGFLRSQLDLGPDFE